MRQEELVAMQSQISTLRYGITGCVVLIGVAAQSATDQYLGWAIALALVPLVVLFSAVIWMGEYERMARAGHYVGLLEADINRNRVNESWLPLRWESWLRAGGSTQSRIIGGHHRYLAIACAFIGFHTAAVVMGTHFYWHRHSHDPSRRWLIPVALAINFGILLTLLGYFRSSYERLRGFAGESADPKRVVRQRLRMRVRLYSLLGAVSFISAPIYSWPLGIIGVASLNNGGWFGHLSAYWIALPTVIWMAVVPLVASRSVMHELLGRRVLLEEELSKSTLAILEGGGLLNQLTEWEKTRLRVVLSDEANAPAIGRSKNVTVTRDAVENKPSFPGALAHELAHHRLHHLHPLALSYLYLWPYLYYDDEVLRLTSGKDRGRALRLIGVLGRTLFTLAAVPGWLAWMLLRWGWRTAEYDADRFAYMSGNGEMLEAVLLRHQARRQARRPRRWRDRVQMGMDRVEQGRALGYLPIPNEHPSPGRRLKRLKRWTWTLNATSSRRGLVDG